MLNVVRHVPVEAEAMDTVQCRWVLISLVLAYLFWFSSLRNDTNDFPLRTDSAFLNPDKISSQKTMRFPVVGSRSVGISRTSPVERHRKVCKSGLSGWASMLNELLWGMLGYGAVGQS
jgi:hypothetical protein